MLTSSSHGKFGFSKMLNLEKLYTPLFHSYRAFIW